MYSKCLCNLVRLWECKETMQSSIITELASVQELHNYSTYLQPAIGAVKTPQK